MFPLLPYSFMFMLTLMIGSILSISSVHWLGIWGGLELNLIGFLPVLVHQKNMLESESGVKYFIVQALGSSFLIFGSLLVYNLSYTWEIPMSLGVMGKLGLFVMISGLCMKLGIFPFHFWLPSVMAGLSWISCMILATWQKLAPLFLMMILFELKEYYWLVIVLCLMSGISSLVGGWGGMNQTQVRSLLGYSSISHLGWMLFAMIHGEFIMKIYFMVYVATSICIFLSLMYLNIGMMKNLSTLKNLHFSQLSVMVMLLSLGGLPPLLGFVPKWYLISLSFNGSYSLFVFMLMFGSLLSLFYYLSLFFSIFLGLKNGYMFAKVESNESILLMFMVFLNLVGGVLILFSNLFILI
uniref:NADH-ubiquinone oxidoreductase chain 2 n=1 Tax=Bivetiella cancellata TaxID=543397 RepID=C8XQP6_BIVCA|nr:NADH dehydrogenase subunit 2 [Bivetiella cancellata]ACF04826.1 NADH dehydrogenase subunit 2 [Bivetiella cancellata]